MASNTSSSSSSPTPRRLTIRVRPRTGEDRSEAADNGSIGSDDAGSSQNLDEVSAEHSVQPPQNKSIFLKSTPSADHKRTAAIDQVHIATKRPRIVLRLSKSKHEHDLEADCRRRLDFLENRGNNPAFVSQLLPSIRKIMTESKWKTLIVYTDHLTTYPNEKKWRSNKRFARFSVAKRLLRVCESYVCEMYYAETHNILLDCAVVDEEFGALVSDILQAGDRADAEGAEEAGIKQWERGETVGLLDCKGLCMVGVEGFADDEAHAYGEDEASDDSEA